MFKTLALLVFVAGVAGAQDAPRKGKPCGKSFIAQNRVCHKAVTLSKVAPVTVAVNPPSAICRDSTIARNAKRSGTCSGHKGVAFWYAYDSTGKIAGRVAVVRGSDTPAR